MRCALRVRVRAVGLGLAAGAAVACLGAAVACLGAAGAAARADAGEAAQSDERALEITRRMAAALAGAGSLRLTAQMAYDAVQDDGQGIEFGASRRFAIRRPDRARIEAVDRSGPEILFVYDGERIVLFDEAHGVYATAAHRGDLQSMQAYAREELRVPTPLSDFLSLELFDILAASDSVRWVDEQTLGGVPCDHLAFRRPGRGLQVWVPRQGEPLPRRVVITYEDAPGRPQFRADLGDWELGPELADALFEFSPPPEAERIHFNTGTRIVPGFPLEEGSR